jgi:hypothetical protein
MGANISALDAAQTQITFTCGAQTCGSPGPYPDVLEELTVSNARGGGTVTDNFSLISCPATCAAFYGQNSTVILTATPAGGYVFGGWSGACSGTGTCTLLMVTAESVTASFVAATPTNGFAIVPGSGGITITKGWSVKP